MPLPPGAARAEVRGWSILALVIAVPLALLMLFPTGWAHSCRAPPGSIWRSALDSAMANFTIRGVEQSHTIADGTRVLAIHGEVVSGRQRPSRAGAAVPSQGCQWPRGLCLTLKGVLTRSLKPGEATGFTTRLGLAATSARGLERSLPAPPKSRNPRP